MSKYARAMESVADHVSCWISPTGEFHAVPECGHERYCREHIFGLEPDSSEFYNHPGAVKLEKEGWLHVSAGCVRNDVSKVYQAAVDTLFDFCCVVEKAELASQWRRINLQMEVKRLIELAS